MQDEEKTKDQLLSELRRLRQQVARLEKERQELKNPEARNAHGSRVRGKATGISLPEGVYATMELSDILDANEIQPIMDALCDLTSIGFAILDLQGNILASTGWQDVCKNFHRIHPETSRNCLESDIELARDVIPGRFKLYRCKNNMWDMSTPITVGGKQVGNLFSGQFFFADETLDMDFFRSQALRYGFDQQEYLAALGRVPRCSREKISAVMTLYTELAHLISALGYGHVKLAQALTEKEASLDSLRRSEEKIRRLFASINDAVFVHLLNDDGTPGRFIEVNEVACRRLGYSRQELLQMTPADIAQADRKAVPTEIGKRLLIERNLLLETIQVAKDARQVPVESHFTVLAHAGQQAVLSISRDITGRKQAQEAQTGLQAQLANALEMAQLGPWEYHVASDLFTFNDQFYKMFRTTATEVGGYTLSSAQYSARFVHPEDRHLVAEETRTALAASDPRFSRQLEHRILYPDGAIGFISVRFSIVKDEHGRTIKTYGVNQDITERKLAEQGLRESEEKYRSLFESMTQGVIYESACGDFIDINQAALDMLGLTEDEFFGRTVRSPSWKIIREDGSTFSVEEYPTMVAQRTGKPVKDVTLGVFNPNQGDYVWLTVNAIPQFHQGEAVPHRVFLTMHDLTELKRAEEALRASEKEYRKLFENAPIGIFRTNSLGHVFAVNAAMAQMLGFSSPQQALERYSDLRSQLYVHPERREQFVQLLREKGHAEDFEYEAKTFDGRKIWLSMNARVESCDEDGILIIEGFTTDITGRKRAEQERQKLEAQLRQAQKMEAVGTLAGGIAHEFNNILGIILGNAELAKDDIPEWSPAGSNLDEIKGASLRARDVVRQLLTFSRKGEEDQQPLDLTLVAREAIRFLRASIPTSIEIRQNIADRCHTIIADATQIHQVVLNLSTNAAHAMEETGGILEFSLRNFALQKGDQRFAAKLSPGEYVLLEVTDTGAGIPTEILNRIFDPYFTTKEIGKGTGMGLAVVHGIVEAHGGSIRVESSPGKGTTFQILFPAASEKAGPVLEQEEELATGSEQILFIDDEPSIAALGKLMLARLGYQVQSQTHPGKALEIFTDNPQQFDLIITDTTMPGMTGDQLITRILKIRPEMKTILCTGYSERVDEESALAMGAKAYIMKPLDRQKLAKTVRKVLDDTT